MEAEYELILSLCELRGFLSHRPSTYKILASLNGISHETEEVRTPSSRILFHEDLTWSLCRSTYHSLRSRKVPIRVSVLEKGSKVGQVVLDLKEAFPLPEGTLTEDFVMSKGILSRILGARKEPTLGDYPSLKWLLTINTHPEKNLPRAPQSPSQGLQPTPEDQIEAILNIKEGHFVIGSSPTEIFHLNIEIYFASNLHLAIKKDILDLVEENSYYFSYDILGETITTVPFSNLQEPNFNVEEATINIISSYSDIVEYFSQQPPLCISVCSTKYILARMYFSLPQMLELSENNLREKRTLRSSRVFPFENSRDSSLGISISLKAKGPSSKEKAVVEPIPQATEEKEVSQGGSESIYHNKRPESTQEFSKNIEPSPRNRRLIPESTKGFSKGTDPSPQTSVSDRQENLPKLPSTIKDPEVSYRLTIELKTIQFDNSISKTIRLRYKYSPLMKDEEVDSHDFAVQPNVRTSIPYGKCHFTFKAEPKLCYLILKKKPLTVHVLDVKGRNKTMGQSVLDLSKVLVGENVSSASKEVQISSPIRNLVKREIGTLYCRVLLVVDDPSSPSEPNVPDNVQEWKSRERIQIEERLQREWDKRESERTAGLQENLRKYDKLEQTMTEYLQKHQAMESALHDKDQKISNLNQQLCHEADRFSHRLNEVSLQSLELNKSHKKESDRLRAKIRDLEMESDNLRGVLASKDKIIQEMNKENARLSISNDKLTNEVFELQYQLDAEKKANQKSLAPEKRIFEELDEVPSKSSKDHSSESRLRYERSLITENEIRRLIREKETILRTGDYKEDDDIVLSITRQIQALSVPRTD